MSSPRLVSLLGGIDAVILSAGVGRFGAVESFPLADWEATLTTNLTAPFLCARAAIPHLRARGSGAIVAVSSGAGKQGYPELAAYSASKFGLMGFMQGLAGEVAADGIKVSVVVPGSILTPFGGRSIDDKRAAMANDPGKKYLEPEDVAEAILLPAPPAQARLDPRAEPLALLKGSRHIELPGPLRVLPVCQRGALAPRGGGGRLRNNLGLDRARDARC